MATTGIVEIEARKIVPPHEVRDRAKLDAISASMTADGWAGRPLLVMEEGDHYVALTGSHRHAAAVEADLDAIPCVLADAEAFYAEYPDAEPGRDRGMPWRDDSDKLAVFRALGDEAAAGLIEAEIDANE